MVRILNRNSPDLDLGEHPPRRIEEDRLTSSPPVRGTHAPLIAAELRFIPACAGNTRPRRNHAPYAPVHPRLCGEHRDFIPACAGNTAHGKKSVHPRCAGLNVTSGSSPPVRGTGSSPPVRGTRGVHPRLCGEQGPVHPRLCAGSSPLRGTMPPVHPRLCGEHLSARPVHPRLCGEQRR